MFLANIDQENVFYDILEGNNAFLSYKQKKFKNSRNWEFSKGVNPWFWSRNCHFFNFFFLANIAQENVFYDILERNKAFLRHKNKKFQKSRKWDFSKGVNPWFWSKNGHFSHFFLANIHQKNVFYDILEGNNAFLSYKKKKFKNSRNWDFSKGVNPWFWSRNRYFSNFFFFSQYSPGKCVLRYSRTKKSLSRL